MNHFDSLKYIAFARFGVHMANCLRTPAKPRCPCATQTRMTDVKGDSPTAPSAQAKQHKRHCNAAVATLNIAAATLPPLGYYAYLAKRSWSDLDSAGATLKFCAWMLQVHGYFALCGAGLLVASFARASTALAVAVCGLDALAVLWALHYIAHHPLELTTLAYAGATAAFVCAVVWTAFTVYVRHAAPHYAPRVLALCEQHCAQPCARSGAVADNKV